MFYDDGLTFQNSTPSKNQIFDFTPFFSFVVIMEQNRCKLLCSTCAGRLLLFQKARLAVSSRNANYSVIKRHSLRGQTIPLTESWSCPSTFGCKWKVVYASKVDVTAWTCLLMIFLHVESIGLFCCCSRAVSAAPRRKNQNQDRVVVRCVRCSECSGWGVNLRECAR